MTGSGEGVSQGQVAVVHYTGWLYEPTAADQKGKQFDSSRGRGEPFRFTRGAGNVIKGWDEGLQGMQAGGQRRLVVPASPGLRLPSTAIAAAQVIPDFPATPSIAPFTRR